MALDPSFPKRALLALAVVHAGCQLAAFLPAHWNRRDPISDRTVYYLAARAVLEPLGARVQLSQIVLGRAPSADPVADFATEFVADDQVEALVALVREGDRTTFREQAQLLGVPTDKLDELWTGTRARLRLGDKSAPVAP